MIVDVVLYLFDIVYFVFVYLLVGIEYFGLIFGFVEFFDNCWLLVVFFVEVDCVVVEKVIVFWKGFGLNVEEMEFDYYDLVLVVILYMLYFIVYMMVGVVDDLC